MNQYLIPANAKKSQLIFNVFRMSDLIIFATGIAITTILMFVITGDSISDLLFKLAPVAICGFLVMPLPFYHNVLVFLQEVYIYLTRPRRYLWRGWCASYVSNEDGQNDGQKNRR